MWCESTHVMQTWSCCVHRVSGASFWCLSHFMSPLFTGGEALLSESPIICKAAIVSTCAFLDAWASVHFFIFWLFVHFALDLDIFLWLAPFRSYSLALSALAESWYFAPYLWVCLLSISRQRQHVSIFKERQSMLPWRPRYGTVRHAFHNI